MECGGGGGEGWRGEVRSGEGMQGVGVERGQGGGGGRLGRRVEK